MQQVTSHELGDGSFDNCDRQVAERRLVHRLEALGYVVSRAPTSPAAGTLRELIFTPVTKKSTLRTGAHPPSGRFPLRLRQAYSLVQAKR